MESTTYGDVKYRFKKKFSGKPYLLYKFVSVFLIRKKRNKVIDDFIGSIER